MNTAAEPLLSSLDKVLWPEAGFTKGQMIDYYRRIAPVLLPHLEGRPLVLGCFPRGVEERGFAQTECRGAPEWLRTVPVRLRGARVRRFCVVDELRSLLWVANQNAIELHPLLASPERPERGKVLVDWLQNEPMRSTVAPYSLRSTPWPTVSTPVGWDELAAAVEERRPEVLVFLPDDVLERIERLGDLFGPALERR